MAKENKLEGQRHPTKRPQSAPPQRTTAEHTDNPQPTNIGIFLVPLRNHSQSYVRYMATAPATATA